MFIVWRVLFLESRGVELLIGKPFGGLRALSLSKRQCHSLWMRLAILEDLDRLLPGILLTAIDLAQIKHMALEHSATGHASVLDDAPIAM